MRSTRTSVAAEDYLKAIYLLESRDAAVPVTISALAGRLHVRPPSVTGMIRRLASEGLVEHERYEGVRLTEAGRKRALAMVRRHRLLETLLVQELGMGWDEVHAEAEALEHAVSDHLLEHIAAKLGEPRLDPHGDPIPSADYEVEEAETEVLEGLPVGSRVRVVRVLDADPELLAYLDELGVTLGGELEVLEAEPFGGSLRIVLDGRQCSLGRLAARALAVQEVAG